MNHAVKQVILRYKSDGIFDKPMEDLRQQAIENEMSANKYLLQILREAREKIKEAGATLKKENQ